jgi:outer membrane protein assembly factor BamB
MSDSPAEAPRRAGWLRRWRVPLTILGLSVALLLAPEAGLRLDLDPELVFRVQMYGTMASVLLLLLLPLWLLLFSGLRWRTRGMILGSLALAGAGLALSVRKAELNANFEPRLSFRWQADPQERLQARLDQATDPAQEQLPPLDLRITPLTDFPRFRGSAGDGVIHGVKLLDWGKGGPSIRWKQPCGGGYSGIVVAGNALVTLEQRGANEAVVCYDRETGRERWKYEYPALFEQTEPMGGSGPRATPTIAPDGLVYSLGATGELVCLEGKTGGLKWQVNILTLNGSKNLVFGMSGSPLVVGDRIYVAPGADADNPDSRSLLILDRQTGRRLAGSGRRKGSYASPQLARLDGVPQVLVFDVPGLVSYELETGKELWSIEWTSWMDMNISQPLVIGGDRVFLSSQPGVGGGLYRVQQKGEAWTVTPLWQNKYLHTNFNNPVAVGEYIYGLSGSRGLLVCLDAKDGKRLWSNGRYGAGQMLAVGDRLLIQTESGELALVAADPQAWRELGRFRVLEGAKSWNNPAMAGNRLYLRNHNELACVEVPAVAR